MPEKERLGEMHFPHQYNKGDVAYLAGQLWRLEQLNAEEPSTRANTSQGFSHGNCNDYHHSSERNEELPTNFPTL